MQKGVNYEPHLHAEQLGVPVEYGRLRDGRKGEYLHSDGRIILRLGMSRRQERCTLAHEIQHALAADVRSLFGLVNARQEVRADLRAARLLIDVDEYRAAEGIYGPHCGAIADELDVTLHILSVWRQRSHLLVSA